MSPYVMKVELNWLLDDTVAAMRILDASEWQPATWRQLEPNHKLQSMPLDLPSTNTASVALRADIATLTEWWKLRIEHRCVT